MILVLGFCPLVTRTSGGFHLKLFLDNCNASESEEICNMNTWKWVYGDIHRLLNKCFVVSSFEVKFSLLKLI